VRSLTPDQIEDALDRFAATGRAQATISKYRRTLAMALDWAPNILRHTAASLMADAGVPIEEVADQLGHHDTRMASLHYRHRIRPTVSGATTLGAVLGRR
jgi:integrase